jgi:hypothetical protein
VRLQWARARRAEDDGRDGGDDDFGPEDDFGGALRASRRAGTEAGADADDDREALVLLALGAAVLVLLVVRGHIAERLRREAERNGGAPVPAQPQPGQVPVAPR